MRQVSPVDGFRLAYDRAGRGPPVLPLHGWPGGRTDYREAAPRLAAAAEIITPDLRAFGESDHHRPIRPPSTAPRPRPAAWPGSSGNCALSGR